MNKKDARPRALTISVPEPVLRELAEQVATLVTEQLAPPQSVSPWLDAEGAMAYLGFSRDRLYKLTAAKAIPYRKKHGGQGLLFHRDELDRWVESAYEPTGCVAKVELWSTATSEIAPATRERPGARQRRNRSDAIEG
jgi:excisionase family DNA binding protein